MPPPGAKRRSYRVGPASTRRCWTCRDRKIACDLARPECGNCVTAKRKCQGYGLRLNWPTVGDSRRLVVEGGPNGGSLPLDVRKTLQFVNATMSHVELYYARGLNAHEKSFLSNLSLISPAHISNLSNPPKGYEQHLVTYFMTNVIESLAPIQKDGQNLWSLLFKLSFSDDSLESRAVLQAILSVSYLYRYGHGQEAVRLKVAALSSLSNSIKETLITQCEIYKHVAVGMLLCSFEVFIASDSSFQWPLYVSGAKRMLHNLCVNNYPREGEVDMLVSWVHYHDVLARFISRHWKRQTREQIAIDNTPGIVSSIVAAMPKSQVSGMFGCSLEMMDLISRMCSIAPNSRLRNHSNPADNQLLDSLEQKLLTIHQDPQPPSETNNTEEIEREGKIAELYRLAGLLYLERVLRNNNTSTPKTDAWVSSAFHIISEMETCRRPFPMLFVGIEARTDEQRGEILSLLERSRRRIDQNCLCGVQTVIESVWIQHDLRRDAEAVPNYLGALDSVMGTFEFMPPLA